jgi:hypothetical protein
MSDSFVGKDWDSEQHCDDFITIRDGVYPAVVFSNVT